MVIECTVNGEKMQLEVAPKERLLDVLRNQLQLTGAKEGCGVGECGSCTVIVDGRAVHACLMLACQMDGKNILTVEGLKKDNEPDPLQRAFVEHGAVQCGYCTPGMLMSARALLMKNPHPSLEEIKEALAGNLCRCTGYNRIIKAVEAVVEDNEE